MPIAKKVVQNSAKWSNALPKNLRFIYKLPILSFTGH